MRRPRNRSGCYIFLTLVSLPLATLPAAADPPTQQMIDAFRSQLGPATNAMVQLPMSGGGYDEETQHQLNQAESDLKELKDDDDCGELVHQICDRGGECGNTQKLVADALKAQRQKPKVTKISDNFDKTSGCRDLDQHSKQALECANYLTEKQRERLAVNAAAVQNASYNTSWSREKAKECLDAIFHQPDVSQLTKDTITAIGSRIQSETAKDGKTTTY